MADSEEQNLYLKGCVFSLNMDLWKLCAFLSPKVATSRDFHCMIHCGVDSMMENVQV